MYQKFTTQAEPEHSRIRLTKLRKVMKSKGFDGFLIPRSDAHQSETVPPSDARLSWLTGFTGSAGFCAALQDNAGVFTDGRYRLQIRNQIDLSCFSPLDFYDVKLSDWLIEKLPDGGSIGYDPWLHTNGEIDTLTAELERSGIQLESSENLIDLIWLDRPSPPLQPMVPHPLEFAGVSHKEKRARISEALRSDGQKAAVLTQPDAIAWLLNTRGEDIDHIPVALCFAILDADGGVTLFMAPEKSSAELRRHLGSEVSIVSLENFRQTLQALNGPIRVDQKTTPKWVHDVLKNSNITVEFAPDPTALPKAVKNPVEIAGMTNSHLRDGVAMASFLAWLDGLGSAPDLTEIDVVKKLEDFRRKSGELLGISFDTISGSGPNGAIIHYRVTEDSNRRIETSDILLVDSGGQYRDGTTDITRTMAIGPPPQEAIKAFTLVLKGMIAMSALRWPAGLAGRDIDAVARKPLWQNGMDYDHGTGHGVGCFLSVHEGPAALSRRSDVSLQPGMVLSNEPGYYKPGEFGIRIENVMVVETAPRLEDGDERDMLQFQTLTYCPIDTALIDKSLLTNPEIAWLNNYHAATYAKLHKDLPRTVRAWLKQACAPL